MATVTVSQFKFNEMKQHSFIIVINNDIYKRNIFVTQLCNELYENNLVDKVTFLYDNIYDDNEICKQVNDVIEHQISTSFKSRLLVVFDLKFSQNSKFVREIVNNGRYYNITFLLAISYGTQLTPITRYNSDYVFAYKSTDMSILHHKYLFFDSLELLDEVTQNIKSDEYIVKVCRQCTDNSIYWTKANDCVFLSVPNKNILNLKKNASLSQLTQMINNNQNCEDVTDFCCDDICDNFSMLFVGKSGCGKTISMLNICKSLYENKKIDKFLFFGKACSKFDFFIERDDQLIIHSLLDYCEMSKTTEKFMVVFDDLPLNDEIYNFLSSCKKYNISYMISTQYPLKINVDYVFLYDHFNKTELYKLYGGIYPSFSKFNELYTSLTRDYAAMVINNKKFLKIHEYGRQHMQSEYKFPLFSNYITDKNYQSLSDSYDSFCTDNTCEKCDSNNDSERCDSERCYSADESERCYSDDSFEKCNSVDSFEKCDIEKHSESNDIEKILSKIVECNNLVLNVIKEKNINTKLVDTIIDSNILATNMYYNLL